MPIGVHLISASMLMDMYTHICEQKQLFQTTVCANFYKIYFKIIFLEPMQPLV